MKTTNSHDFEFQKLKSIKPSMMYDGTIPFDEWQKKASEKLTELLGLPFEKCDDEFTIEYVKDEENHTEYRFTVQTEKGYYVPCHLLIPKDAGTSIPLTMCLSGHGAGMHIALGVVKKEADERALREWPHRAMAPRAIKEKRCALVIEARNFGESSLEGYGSTCEETAENAILIGRTVIGERVWDAMRILDVVGEKFNEVDMTDIMCTGNSGGGTATYYLGCLDKRISIVAPSCSVCTYEDSIAAMSHCICNYIPGIRKYFEMGDLAGIIVPRKLIIAAGEKDSIFPIHGVKKAFETAKHMYKINNVDERCVLVVGDDGHFNYADLIWEQVHKMA